ncbi:TetR/AcrR family transcriptional regulator [Marinomonas piezotolerans]|uniref:TetR/AcrR family transcriptional regulator n=1 Tax=Marinomonas piezotolerans TaxID=2213058 RepID=A0A370UD72_9GAMM|nr:TetR/AcrR family transcriptional regulator [Marinomonas piezotolerans]RDL45742.1 TetR/AcrR family transcriptional regulator [Marinomonas piezotolerans]
MSAGRQRAFDKEYALMEAMKVFWLKGYSGASLRDLTEAMGINKPSVYSAFGSKEELFVSAINQYVDRYGLPNFDALQDMALPLSERLEAYLNALLDMLLDPALPGGCFVTNSTCELGSNCLPDNAMQTILAINKTSIDTYIRFFQAEKLQGNIASDSDPEKLADYLLTQMFGLAVMAKNGVKRDALEQVITLSITAFCVRSH